MTDGYDPKKTLKKMFWVMVYGAIVGGCEAGITFLQGNNFPAEYVVYTTFGIMILTAIVNWAKNHKK
jgi:hypothetical protein